MSVERSSCIFCNIANKLENTELLYDDEEICVFRDIRPAARFHILTIPKFHIEDVKALNSSNKNLVTRMLEISKDLLSKNNLDVSDARFGYHWPPFRSVRHLHLHTIAPESEMGFISKLMFMKNSFWFVSADNKAILVHVILDGRGEAEAIQVNKDDNCLSVAACIVLFSYL